MQALPNATARPLPAAGRPARRGFTLTELLVVIAIIAVLAAMGSWGVMQAMGTAKQTRIKLEVDQLDAALKVYRDKYGSYPPCNWRGLLGNNKLTAHIARAFPRYDMSNLPQVRNELLAAGITNEFRPDQALVFWLKGFSPDPAHPFVTPDGYQIMNGAPTTVKVQVTPLYQFDPTRLATVPLNPASVPSYFPQGSKTDDSGAPYVYWDSGNYTPYGVLPALMWNITDMMSGVTTHFTNAGGMRPYGDETKMDWANSDSFQIIAAGPDAKYGVFPGTKNDPIKLYPSGNGNPNPPGYDVAGTDDDNVTNFCAKARLGDAKP
jgi:prepilin-type N-terminal cleavage/methylation domain-containing protein